MAGNAAAVRQCDGEAMPTQTGIVPTHGGVVPTCACMAGMGVAGVAATTLHQVSCEQDFTAFPYSTALLCICCDLAHLVQRGFVPGQHAVASCCVQHPTWWSCVPVVCLTSLCVAPLASHSAVGSGDQGGTAGSRQAALARPSLGGPVLGRQGGQELQEGPSEGKSTDVSELVKVCPACVSADIFACIYDAVLMD